MNFLLRNPEVQCYIRETAGDEPPQVYLPFFDTTTETLCDELGYERIMPSYELRNRLDSKNTTTELANEIGIESVPNILTTVTDYRDLIAQAKAAGLGDELVIQTAYGDSGLTTYMINDERDFENCASAVVGPKIKVMRHIRPIGFAIEAVATRDGTVVGRLVRELVGVPELTAQSNGWSGSEMSRRLLNDEARATAADYTRRFGDRLYQEGYRGIFGLDFLVDADTGTVYLGELNPRFTGSSIISNVPQHPDTEIPLLAIHLLEYDPEAPIDVATANAVTQRLPEGVTWSSFLVRSRQPGDYVHRNYVLAMCVTRRPLQSEPGVLNEFGEAVVAATREAFSVRPMPSPVRYLRGGLRVAHRALQKLTGGRQRFLPVRFQSSSRNECGDGCKGMGSGTDCGEFAPVGGPVGRV